jgi:hypothetical protein
LEKFERDLMHAVIHSVSTIGAPAVSSNASHIWNETRKSNPNAHSSIKAIRIGLKIQIRLNNSNQFTSIFHNKGVLSRKTLEDI